jgi:hypothetical protein
MYAYQQHVPDCRCKALAALEDFVVAFVEENFWGGGKVMGDVRWARGNSVATACQAGEEELWRGCGTGR